MTKETFRDDVKFLKKYTDVILLSDSTGDCRLAVAPQMQSRVLTSTSKGLTGQSYGWINHELIASEKMSEHINIWGGEDRFWIGPEGGQFSVFFEKGTRFDIDNWYVPAAIDSESFELVSQSDDRAVFKKDMQLENYSGTVFNLRADREIRVLHKDEAFETLSVKPDDAINIVGFESINQITNTGTQMWERQTGLLSIWILGNFNSSPCTTVIIPFETGPESEPGPIVNDAYFDKIPPERLIVKDGVLFFKADGKHRSKIGLSPRRAKSVFGSYEADNQVLTIIRYNKPAGAADYVNSIWKLQDEPYNGDVINSYNDGLIESGKEVFGPFYELETSSSAASLEPGHNISHIHQTFHLQGPEADLDKISMFVFGVSIAEVKSAFSK